ncbi:hypothetical protein F5Y02DRAFT_402102 [Annulohypoxylon stygium]|nr:hypothetical protein F5Y02DRAFT_402102 [Annulohypoxylon stygium]
MGIKHFNQSRNILSIILLTIIFTLSWYTVNPRTSPPVADLSSFNMPASADDVISKLKVSVRQVSGSGSSPAKLALAVTNAHDGAVTILSWNTPLDPLALQLGVVSFFSFASSVPDGSEDDDRTQDNNSAKDNSGSGGDSSGGGEKKIGEKIEVPTIQIRRRMPAGPESLVTIGAGQTHEQEVEVRGPPLERLRGRRVAVACAGEWTGVWLSEADAVAKVSSLHDAGASEGALRGSFQSEPVEIVL